MHNFSHVLIMSVLFVPPPLNFKKSESPLRKVVANRKRIKMFGDMEFIDYRYTRIKPFGYNNKNVSVDIKPPDKDLLKKRLSYPSTKSTLTSAPQKSASVKKKRSDVKTIIMSGELQIVFIYDTLSVQKEEDDPKDAILYFHPDCIPEERRIAICGQLMGITHFLIDTFSAPKILTLDNGKFAMRKFGRQYVLALGCSSVTPDWLLEKQADILYNLTIFFHRDIKSILSSVNGNRIQLASRLSLIMDHYIPISQHHGDLFALTFGVLPILNLPKSASNISLSAAVVLQSCLMQTGVLGGIVMYQNKVLGVELAQELAQKLAFIQPYQLPPAEPVRLQFACPPGVQIFAVFVSEHELDKLRKYSSTFQHPSHCVPKLSNKKENNHKGKIDPIREEDPSDVSSSLGFSEPSSKDSSEGIAELETSLAGSSIDTGKGTSSCEKVTSAIPDAPLIPVNSSLKFEEFLKAAGKGRTLSPSNHASHGQAKTTKSTVKGGEGKESLLVAVPPPCVHMNGCGSNSLKSSRIFKSLGNLRISDDSSGTPTPPPLGGCLCASLTDPYFPFIRCDGKSISKALLDVYSGANESTQITDEDKENEVESELHPKFEGVGKEFQENIPKPPANSNVPNGSLEPSNENSDTKEVCNEVNVSLSTTQNLANSSHTPGEMSLEPLSIPAPRRPMDLPLNNKKYSRKKSKRRWSTFEDMMSPAVDTPSRISESFPAVIPNINESWKNSSTEGNSGVTTNPPQQEIYSSFRKLSSQDELLKSYTHTSTDKTIKLNGSMINGENPSTGKIPSYRPEKVTTDFGSILSRQEINEINVDGNKGGIKSHAHHLDYSEKSVQHNKSKNDERNISTQNHVKSSLFIYSLGSMRLLLLVEHDRCSDAELIQTLWEHGSTSLSELETAILNVEEQTMSTTASQHDHYCYLHYEAVWRSLAHGGRNHSMDFDIVQQMHQDFNVHPNVSELIIRGEDHVVYGYQCVGSEVFYQQSAGLQPGLPMPSDLMGKVPFKAKRRLERDHNILLL